MHAQDQGIQFAAEEIRKILRRGQLQGDQPQGAEQQGQEHGQGQQQQTFFPVLGLPQGNDGDRQQGQHRQQSVGEKTQCDRGPIDRGRQAGAARQQRQSPVNGRVCGQRRQHGLGFVRVKQETYASGKNQRCSGGKVLAVQFARSKKDEFERQQGEQAAGQSCGFMFLQQPGKKFAETGGNPVIKRGIRVGLSGKMRHQPVAAGQHVVHYADRDGVVGFPRIVTDESGEDVERKQNGQCPATGR